MKKYRDGVHLPLIAAIPAMLLLISLSTTPDCAFGREASPALREATDGGGDEWNDMCSSSPTLFHGCPERVLPDDVRLPFVWKVALTISVMTSPCAWIDLVHLRQVSCDHSYVEVREATVLLRKQ
jgi:hypothetical protein